MSRRIAGHRFLWTIASGAGLILPLGHTHAADAAGVAAPPHRFEIGQTDFLLDEQRFQVRCGEKHFARVPHEYWAHLWIAKTSSGVEFVDRSVSWAKLSA